MEKCTSCGKSGCDECQPKIKYKRGPKGEKGDPGRPGLNASAFPPVAVFKQLQNIYDYDLPVDSNFGPGALVVPFNTDTLSSDLEITVPENGDYLAFIEFSAYITYNFSWNYRLLVDSVPVPDSARGVLILGNTPPLTTDTFNSQQALPGLLAGSKVNVQFKSLTFPGGSPTPSPGTGNSFIQFATLIITKVKLL